MAESHRSAVTAYYDSTWLDYRLLWMRGTSGAFHFGYWEPGVRDHAEALARANLVLAERARVKPGERVLDAGCGIGDSTLWLARERGAYAIGASVVRSQVVRAQRLARARGLSGRATFLLADYTRTPLGDASVDVVWALESLCHAPDKAAFYREAARILRPGGRLVIAEYVRAARSFGDAGDRLVREWLDGWAIPDLDTAEEHVANARAAGLHEVELEDRTALTRPSLRRLYGIARMAQPFERIGRLLRIRSATQHGNLRAAIRQWRALEQGLWFYAVLSARKRPVGSRIMSADARDGAARRRWRRG